MIRLIKLLAYSAIGYFVYQMWQGLRDTDAGADGQPGGSGRGNRESRSGLRDDDGRVPNMTGAGRGTVVNSGEESSGMSVPHVVGRGVVSR